jgi:hypothetical protein
MLWRLLIAYEVANWFLVVAITAFVTIKESYYCTKTGDCDRYKRFQAYCMRKMSELQYKTWVGGLLYLAAIGGYRAIVYIDCYYNFLDEDAKLREGEKA